MRHLYDKTFAASLFVIATDRPITLVELVPGLTKTMPGEWHGPCPFCEDGDDRFMVWTAHTRKNGGRYFCRQCGKKGDGIQFLRDCYGWTFARARDLFARTTRQPGHQSAGEGFYAGSSGSAAPPPASSPSGPCGSIENPPVFGALPPHAPDLDPQDLERARAEESTLARAQRISNLPDDLTARADALRADLDMAEIGYRATVRMPALYTDKEKDYWETRLSDLYAKRDSLDQDIEAERHNRKQTRAEDTPLARDHSIREMPPHDDPTTAKAHPNASAYLRSKSWRKKRGAALTIAGYHCRRCFASRDLDVYHLTYDRLFHEDLADLIVLCRKCREAEHPGKSQ